MTEDNVVALHHPGVTADPLGSLGLQRSPFVGRACATSAIQGNIGARPVGASRS